MSYDSVVEVPELLGLLAHLLLNAVDLSEDLYSELFEVLVNAFLVLGVSLGSHRQLSDPANELGVFRERPMPEDCLAVCLLDLRNWNEILTLKCLIDNAVVTFECTVSPRWIGA